MKNNLEKHIKQTQPFQSEYVKAMVGLIFLTNQLYDTHQQLLKQHGITVQQYNVLRILRGQYPKSASIGMIKERMLDKMCDASRIADRLLKNKLVTKEPSPMDKRVSEVTITEKALKLLAMLDTEIAKSDTLLHKMNHTQISDFNELIDSALDFE
jgi:MarR family transcriptional regulator, multiple gene regulator MgrA